MEDLEDTVIRVIISRRKTGNYNQFEDRYKHDLKWNIRTGFYSLQIYKHRLDWRTSESI
jgi:hypothetical protein